jgi:hypothetical protein
MPEFIYLEPDGEITEVIERIREAESDLVVVVIPRGSSLGQSIVNLKLLLRKADDFDKKIAIVCGDQISQNLSRQIGLVCFSRLNDAKKADYKTVFKEAKKEEQEAEEERPTFAEEKEEKVDQSQFGGLKVKKYSKEDKPVEEIAEEGEEVSEDEVDSCPEEETDPEPTEQYKGYERQETDKPAHTSLPKEVVINRPEKESASYVYKGSKRRGSDHTAVKKFTAFLSILLVVGLVFSYVFLPYAKASVVLSTEDLDVSKEILVDTTVVQPDTSNLSLPGEIISLEKEKTKTFNSTGEKNVGEKATGKITIYNSWSVDPQTIASGAVFVSGSKTFISTADVSVPGATISLVEGEQKVIPGTADVAVEAKESGEAYNIGPSTFTITSLPEKRQAKITGQSKEAMKGGSNKIIKFVTEDDLGKAVVTLEEELKPEATAELATLASKKSVIYFTDQLSSETISQDFTKKANEESETFELKLKKIFYAVSFVEKSLKELLKKSVEADLAADMMLVNADKAEIKYEVLTSDVDAGTLKMKADFVGKTGHKYEESEIIKKITNQKLSVAIAEVKSLAGVSDVSIDNWPKFLSRTPLLNLRVTAEFDFEK